MVATINNAIYVCFGTLVVFFDGSRIECGLIGGNNTISIDVNRDKERRQAIMQKRRKRLRKAQRAKANSEKDTKEIRDTGRATRLVLHA